MAKPIAYFGYSREGKTITFNNLSYNAPTSFRWEFGDGTPGINEKNPVKTFNEDGFYKISLIASNDEGDSEPLSIVINISDQNTLGQPIMELINNILPPVISDDSSNDSRLNSINYWQSYLQPLVEDPVPVSLEDTHNEAKWPTLVNNLIANLVARDLILKGSMKFLSQIGEGTQSSNDENIKAQVKSIETGPGKTEWYEKGSGRALSEQMKDLANAYKIMMGDGGIYDALIKDICLLANRVRIFLPICENPNSISPGFVVTKNNCKTGHNANPFGITKRMI